MRSKLALPLVVAAGLGLSACANPYDPGQRAVGGGLLGAGTGAAIGGLVGGGRGAAGRCGDAGHGPRRSGRTPRTRRRARTRPRATAPVPSGLRPAACGLRPAAQPKHAWQAEGPA